MKYADKFCCFSLFCLNTGTENDNVSQNKQKNMHI